MNAAVSVSNEPNVTAQLRRTKSVRADQVVDAPPRGFGVTQLRSIGLSMLVVFVVVAVSLNAYNGEGWGAVGIAAYLAMWVGGGFGFLVGGVAWSIANGHDGQGEVH